MGPKSDRTLSKSASLSSPQKIFRANDAVMATDTSYTSGGKLYKSVIIRAEKMDVGEFKYLIHYNGWKRKYDVWMDGSQLALCSDEEEVEKLQEKQNAFNRKKLGADTAITAATDMKIETEGGNSSSSSSSKKRGKEGAAALLDEDRAIKRNRAVLSKNCISEETEEDKAAMASMDLPLSLKRKLVNEWSLIAEKEPKRLLKLPRKKTVKIIIDDYLEYKMNGKDKEKEKQKSSSSSTTSTTNSSSNIQEIKEFCESLMIYFDRSLPVILLYRQEREQYENAAKYMELKSSTSTSTSNDVSKPLQPSEVYGGEHLNRLFVKLSKALNSVVAKPDELGSYKEKSLDFLKWFGKNSKEYLIDEDYKIYDEAFAVDGILAEHNENKNKKNENVNVNEAVSSIVSP